MDNTIADSIEQFRNRKIHSTLDAAMLRAIPDADVEQAIFDYVTTQLEKNYPREAQIVAGLAPGTRALYLTWIVEGEVNNGGFNQYYYNTGGLEENSSALRIARIRTSPELFEGK